MDSLNLERFKQTPLCFLSHLVKGNEFIIIFLRNNKKIVAKLKAFDKHFNLILSNVREIWNENYSKGKILFKERYMSKMLLRGDSIIIIMPLKKPEVS